MINRSKQIKRKVRKMNEYIKRKNLVDLVLSKLKYLGDARIMNEGDEKVLSEIDGYEKALEDVHKLILDKDLIENVQPVKHGRWEETHISLCKWIPEGEKEEGHSFYMAELKCSCCKRYNAVTFALTLDKPDFCQLCGARMDLKDGDAE